MTGAIRWASNLKGSHGARVKEEISAHGMVAGHPEAREASLSPEELTISHGARTFAAQGWGPKDGIRVLALHGWLDNAASFARLAPLLSGCRVVALDLPGHGLSPHKACDFYNFADYVPDAVAATEGLGWRRFSLLGHSMGAGISTLLAGAFPERVERLALIEGIGPLSSEPGASPAALRLAWEKLTALKDKKPPSYASFEDAVAARAAGGAGISREAATMLCRRGLEQRAERWCWRNDARLTLPSLIRLTEDQVLAFIAAIEAPTLLIRARDGLRFDMRKMEQRVAQLRGVTLREIDGGHHLHLESAAREVADAVRAHFN